MLKMLHPRHLALAGFAIVFAGTGAAAPLPIRIADGATWTFTALHKRTWDPSSASQPDFTAVIAKRLTWRGGKAPSLLVSPLPAPGGSAPPGVDASQTLDVPVLVQVDAALRPLGFVNPGEAHAATEQLLLRLGGARKVALAKEVHPDVLDLTAKALTLRELGVLGRAQGLDLEPGRAVSMTTEYPNPLGGENVPCQETFELESPSAAPGRAVVTWRQVPDLSSVRDSVEKLTERTLRKTSGPSIGRDGAEGLTGRDEPRPDPGGASGRRDLGAPRMTSLCRYVIDLATGLAIEAQCTFEVLMEITGGPQRLVDQWSISQDPPPPPAKSDPGR